MLPQIDMGSEPGAPPAAEVDSRDPEPSDALLWSSVSRGDLAAFESIVRRHQASLIRFLMRVTGNLADAEDVAQETFLSALKKPGAFQGRASLRSWLFAIAKNTARASLRSQSRRDRRELARSRTQETAAPDPSESWLAELLEKISPKLREALLLCDVQGLTYEEAADVLRCPVRTISTRLFRARERMARLLKESDPD